MQKWVMLTWHWLVKKHFPVASTSQMMRLHTYQASRFVVAQIQDWSDHSFKLCCCFKGQVVNTSNVSDQEINGRDKCRFEQSSSPKMGSNKWTSCLHHICGESKDWTWKILLWTSWLVCEQRVSTSWCITRWSGYLFLLWRWFDWNKVHRDENPTTVIDKEHSLILVEISAYHIHTTTTFKCRAS